MCGTIKQVSWKRVKELLSSGELRNTKNGFVDKKGNTVGYYRTCGGKRYIEDRFAE